MVLRLRVLPGFRSGCGCSWREAARVVGDGVAVVVRPDVVRFVVAHGCEAAQIGARVWRSVCAMMPFGMWLLMGVRLLRLGRGVAVCVACLLMAWWCCSAPDVLAKGCRHGLREREGMKEWNGKEIKKVRAYHCPNLDN